MKPHHLLLPALLLLAWQSTLADNGPQSVLIQQDNVRSDLTTLPGRTTDRQDRCSELAKQMEELKGKPQRRYAIAQQYEAECQRR